VDQSKKVLVLDLASDIDDDFLSGCTQSLSFLQLGDNVGLLEELASTVPPIILINARQADSETLQLCHRIKRQAGYERSYLLLCLEAVDLPHCQDGLCPIDDILLKPLSRVELGVRLQFANRRQSGQAGLLEEREFFRKAVVQEEFLSRKLLERQQYLKTSLADTVRRNQELKSAHKKLKRQAGYDVLTGLLNRASLNDRLELEVAKSVAEQSPLCGMMIDIDYFKTVNDSWGHQAGDMVLGRLGRLFKQQLRRNDHAGRYGGEEFFIILPATKLEDALPIARRIQVAIGAACFDWNDNCLSITISVGLVEYTASENLAHWINRADAALYRAKDNGRDRIFYEQAGALLDYPVSSAATSAQR